jgi:hypothetical protein
MRARPGKSGVGAELMVSGIYVKLEVIIVKQ